MGPGVASPALGTYVGRCGCIIMVIVNVLIISALVLLAHAASAIGGSPGVSQDPRLASEIQLGLGLMLSGFALDFVGIAVLGAGHVLAGASLTKALRGRVVAPGQLRLLGLAVAALCFIWVGLTYAWRGLFPAPDSNLVGDLLSAFEAGNYNVQGLMSFRAGGQSFAVALMVASAVVLLIGAVLSSYFLQRVAVLFRTPRKFHLTQWPVLAIINLASSVLLAVSIGGSSAPSILGTIAGGGLKLLLVPTLGISVYLSVYRNFQELGGATTRFAMPAIPTDPTPQRPVIAPQPAVVVARPQAFLTPVLRPAAVHAEPARAPTSAPSAASATVVPAIISPIPREAAPRPVAELTEHEITAEIQRHEAAIRRVEDLYLSGQIRIDAYADFKALQKARLGELRQRLHPASAVPQPTLVFASPAPAEEPKPIEVPPTLPSGRSLDLAPSTRPLQDLTMDDISEEIARNQKAVAAVEEMVRAGEIDEDLGKQAVAARRGRTLDLQSRYEELRFDMLTAEPVPEEEPNPLEKETASRTDSPLLLPSGQDAEDGGPPVESSAPKAEPGPPEPTAPLAEERVRPEVPLQERVGGPDPTPSATPTPATSPAPAEQAPGEPKATRKPRRSRKKRTEEPGNG